MQFDPKSGKIDKKYMLSLIPIASASATDRSAEHDGGEESSKKAVSGSPIKKQKKDTGSTSKYFSEAADKMKRSEEKYCKKTPSMSSSAPTDGELRETILQMIGERAAGKTC